MLINLPSNPCQACFPGATPITMQTFRHTFTDNRPAVSADITQQPSNYCRKSAAAAGGALGSKGSCAFERRLLRCRRIRSTTRGSGIKDTMRMRPPHFHSRGPASKDVVSYYTSRNICVAGFMARSLIDNLAGGLPHVHLTIRGIIKPLMSVTAAARLKNSFSAPSPDDSF